jgi:GGDEF domain-containing protein
MIYKNRFLLQRKFLRSLKNKSDKLNIAFASIDLDNVGKIHGIWGRGAAGYVIKLYEEELLQLIKEHDYALFVYARGDEFEILSNKYTAFELKAIIDDFRQRVMLKHSNKYHVIVSRIPTPHIYRGMYLKFTTRKKQVTKLDSFNGGVLFFPNFSCGVVEGLFTAEVSMLTATDTLRFFGTLVLNEAKMSKGSTVIYPKAITEDSNLGKEFGVTSIESKFKKYNKKLKRNMSIDDHNINLIEFDHALKKNPFAKYKKYLLLEFLWQGPALDELVSKGVDVRGGIDGYGLKGMINLVDPNTLYYLIAQNMECAVNVFNHHRVNERTARMTRFLDRMEIYFNTPLSDENLLKVADEISFSVNEKIKRLSDGFEVRVFLTLRSASRGRKAASFRSYLEFVSKIESDGAEGWKQYSAQGNILAIFNTSMTPKIIAYQTNRAKLSSEKLLHN